MILIVLLLTFGLAAALDFAPVIRQKRAGDIWVYGAIFALAFAVGILFALGVPIPGVYGF